MIYEQTFVCVSFSLNMFRPNAMSLSPSHLRGKCYVQERSQATCMCTVYKIIGFVNIQLE